MLKSAIVLFICTIVSKILGFVRELVVAYKFGAGEITDAFVTTNRVPTILFSALSVAISINFIPVLVGITGGKKEQEKFASNLINMSVLLMSVGIVLILCFPDAVLMIFASGLKGKAYLYAVKMLRITAFSVVPIVLSQIFQSYMQTKDRFLSTGLTGIVCNIVVILFAFVTTEETYQLLSVGTLVSNLVMMIFMIMELKRTRFHYDFVLNIRDKNLKLLILLTLPLIVETLTSELNAIVDSNMASRLDSGTITSLSYANNLVKMANVMIATTIITIVFPKFSKYFAKKNMESLKKEFTYYGDILAMALIPLSIIMIVLSEPIINFLFLRGEFDQQAAVITKESMIWYAIGIFPLGMKAYVIRMFYAFKDTKTPTKYAVVSLGVNIVLNFLLIVPLRHIGLALSTSLASALSYMLLMKKLAPILHMNFLEQIVKRNFKIIFASTLSGGVIYLLYISFLRNCGELWVLLSMGILYIFVYMLVLYIMKYYLLSDILMMIRAKLINMKK